MKALAICDFKTNAKSFLKVHTLAKHEGVKYNCKKCDYKGSSKLVLLQHVRS